MAETKGEAAAVPQSRVLKAVRVDEELVIAQRRTEANRMLEMAKQTAASVIGHARDQGMTEGRNMVMNSTLEEMRRVLSEFSSLVHKREDAFVDIVMNAVEKIIGQTPKKALVRQLISAALADMIDSIKIVLKVSAEDLNAVKEIIIKMQEDGQGTNVISVIVDPLLSNGEMLLETERGRIHIGLAQQLARLRAGFHQVAQSKS